MKAGRSTMDDKARLSPPAFHPYGAVIAVNSPVTTTRWVFDVGGQQVINVSRASSVGAM